MSSKKALEKFNLDYKAMKKELDERAKELFKAASKSLFEENPSLESFGWKQYTIYFNDGDECNFSVYADEPDINDESGYEIYDMSYQLDKKKDVDEEDEEVKTQRELIRLQEVVREFLQAFPEEVLERMFGDHREIRVTADDVETTSYQDHD